MKQSLIKVPWISLNGKHTIQFSTKFLPQPPMLANVNCFYSIGSEKAWINSSFEKPSLVLWLHVTYRLQNIYDSKPGSNWGFGTDLVKGFMTSPLVETSMSWVGESPWLLWIYWLHFVPFFSTKGPKGFLRVLSIQKLPKLTFAEKNVPPRNRQK